jgi:NADPH2 dehydrogenase
VQSHRRDSARILDFPEKGETMSNLFSEIVVNGKRIKNRVVMPPMVCFEFPTRNGQLTEAHIKHYSDRAKGGVGLIIIEATCVNSRGRLSEGQLGLWADDQIIGFKKIAEACHKHDSVVLVQIHHAGLAVFPTVTKDIFAPSDFRGQTRFTSPETNLKAREMTQDEIRVVQNEFVGAAIRAKKAGLDGVEFHGAHGYLINQFLSPLINHRVDAYGGNLIKRTRFMKEIITGTRKSCGKDFIIGCRMGSNEPDLTSGIAIAQEFEKAGLDLLHVSSGMSTLLKADSGEGFPVPPGFEYNWIVYGGTQIKNNVKIPVIVCNGITSPPRAAALIEKGLADFTAIGKGLLVDPDWVNKAQQKKDPIPCISCQICAYFRPEMVCPQIKKRKMSE